jgi:hypothetical protein
MNDKNLPLWGTTQTPSTLLVPTVCALAFGISTMLFRYEKPVTGGAMAVLWLFISLIGIGLPCPPGATEADSGAGGETGAGVADPLTGASRRYGRRSAAFLLRDSPVGLPLSSRWSRP